MCTLLSTCAAFAQSPDAGRRQYELVCSRCHGGDGMPGFPIPDQDMRELVALLRTLKPTHGSAPVRATVETTDGRTLQGLALNQTSADLQLLSDDQRIHLLRRVGDPDTGP